MKAKALGILTILVAVGLAGGWWYLHRSVTRSPLSDGRVSGTAAAATAPSERAASALLTALPAGTALDPTPPRVKSIDSDQLSARATAVLKAIPSDRYDVDAKAASLGSGIAPLFTFVRDRIRFEAYAGALRGADGTLAAGAGNAVDRSLLLAALLATRGVQTRFATGQLPRERAEVLFTRMFDQQSARTLPPTVTGSDDAGRFWSRVTTRARRDYGVIRAAAGSTVPRPGRASRDVAIGDITSHLWLQANVNGEWQDLDTAFSDAQPGRTYCDVTDTFDTLPDEWQQHVTIRVTTERLDGDTLSTDTALEVTLPAVALVDRRVFLTHVSAATTGGLGGVPGTSGDLWTPILAIDDRVEQGQPIDFSDAPTASIGDALAGGGSSSVLVGEWLEFDTARPGGEHDLTRRTLLDRVGGVWRASADHDPARVRPLVRDAKGPVAARAMYNILFSAGPHDLSRYADEIVALTYASEDEAKSPEATPRPLAARNFAALIWSDHFIIPALNDSPRVRFYTASPRIVVISLTPRPSSDGSLVIEDFDLRRDSLRGMAEDSASEAIVADRRLWFAAFEGALEHESVARDVANADGDPSKVVSTSALLTADGVVTLGPDDLHRVPGLTTDPERAFALSRELEAGNRLIVPKSAFTHGPTGWWEIDPAGEARPVLADLNGATYRDPGYHPFAGHDQYYGEGRTPEIRAAARRAAAKAKAEADRKQGLEYAKLVAAVAVATIAWYEVLSECTGWHISDAIHGLTAAKAAADAGSGGQ